MLHLFLFAMATAPPTTTVPAWDEGNAYLRTLGLASPAAPVPPEQQLSLQVYQIWNKLWHYWIEAPGESKTLTWVMEMHARLAGLVGQCATHATLCEVLTRPVLERARKAVRRSKGAPQDVPRDVYAELCHVLYP